MEMERMKTSTKRQRLIERKGHTFKSKKFDNCRDAALMAGQAIPVQHYDDRKPLDIHSLLGLI